MILVKKEIKYVYLGDTLVRPEAPVPDTYILYMPMTSKTTYLDKSKNGYTITNSGVTFGTYQGVDCGYFNGSSSMVVSEKFSLPNQATFLCRCYLISKSSNYDRKILDFRGSSSGTYFYPYYFCGGINTSPEGYGIGTNGGDNYLSANRSGRWYLLYVLRNGSSITYGVKGYNDGSSSASMDSGAITATHPITIGNDQSGTSRYRYGGLSELILDGKLWTASQVTTYYNNTKATYGY